jgi:hypothetical protein
MIIHREYFDANTVGAIWAGNTENIPGAICQCVNFKSASSDTTFDLTITDEKDIEVRKYTDITECVNDLTPFLVRGIYTVDITNASADEVIKGLLCFREK